jgi:hypothetical protein
MLVIFLENAAFCSLSFATSSSLGGCRACITAATADSTSLFNSGIAISVYYSLKERAAAAARSGVRPPEFVELLPGGLPTSPPSRPECLLEVEDPDGAKLRIHLQGGALPDVAALTRGFREGGA